MTKNQPKDILFRVADLSEEALHKLPSFPGGDRLLEVVNQSRTRLDEMQKRLRGLDVVEQRVEELEQRVKTLEGAKPAEPAVTKPSTTKKPTTPDKPAA